MRTFPEDIRRCIFEFDSTYHLLFQACLNEIQDKVAKKVAHTFLSNSIPRTLGYFEFTYIMQNYKHHVVIEEETSTFFHRRYKLYDCNISTFNESSWYLYL